MPAKIIQKSGAIIATTGAISGLLMGKAPPLTSFLAIKYWPTWLGLACLCLPALLPFWPRSKAGALLGLLTYSLARERQYITQVNLSRCFPELDERQRARLARDAFIENGIGLVETVAGWIRKAGSFRKQTKVLGLDALRAASAEGRGILLLGAHYSTLDLCANLLAPFHPLATTYRPHGNRLFDALMLRGRLSNCEAVLDRGDVRGAVKHLQAGKTLWHAPDQDYGPKHAVYASFFGNLAATTTASSRLARISGAAVFLIRHHRLASAKMYEIEFSPLPADFPGPDEAKNAALVNRLLEQAIRRHPAQYLWMHKRFKTQPGGKPQSPYLGIRAPDRRLSAAQFRELTANSEPALQSGEFDELQLENGLTLRQYPGLAGRCLGRRHPARRLVRRSRLLRLNGFHSLTVDNIFRVPDENITALTYFREEGTALAAMTREQLPIAELAAFYARLHDRRFRFGRINLQKLLLAEEGLHGAGSGHRNMPPAAAGAGLARGRLHGAGSGHRKEPGMDAEQAGGRFCILNPEDVRRGAARLSPARRDKEVKTLLGALKLDKAQAEQFIQGYNKAAG